MSPIDPKTLSAFPARRTIGGDGPKDKHGVGFSAIQEVVDPGLSQYAFVAAQFHAHFLFTAHHGTEYAAKHAFDHADAFFAELAKRTKS